MTRSRPVLVGSYEIVFGDQTVAYSVKRSDRAKYLRFVIRRDTGLTVFVPKKYKLEGLPTLLQKKSRWILKHLNAEDAPLNESRAVRDGDLIPWLGSDIRVVARRVDGSGTHIEFCDGQLVVTLNHDGDTLASALESWYREQAERLIRQRVDELCPVMGVSYHRLTIRQARTRWGSCSPKRNLNFNWKLMLLPEPVIDYVVIHELAHLKEMNHSQKFWAAVAQYCPDWQQHRRWLREHGAEIL